MQPVSPYITWENLSIKQAVQYADENYDEAPSQRGLRSLQSRLGWHCHFIQKFESESRIEFENMNRCTMGVNTIRIYNPVKQGYDHDPDGEFIREWLHELNQVPKELIHETWKMSAMEQDMYGCIIGKDYPVPIVPDIKESYKNASSILWSKKGSKEVKQENNGILKKHVKNPL